MKFLLYGEAELPGSGAWCYAETLRDMGHEVVAYSDRLGLEQYRDSVTHRIYRKITSRILERHRRRHVASLLERAAAERPDVAIILKGLHIKSVDVRALRSFGAWVVIVNHDDFFSRNRGNWSRAQRDALPSYDFIFTTREVNVDEVRRFNPRVEFFPFAYYPRIHRPVESPPEERGLWVSDVVFVGTWERERSRLLEGLVRRVSARYAIWGGLWERIPSGSPLAPYVRHRELFLDDMAKALGGAKMALAFLRKANRDDYTQRTFEIPACGGMLLAERTARHRSYYREGEEAEFFEAGSLDELAVKVRTLLADTEGRERIRRAGREALLRQRHTYRDRLERLIEVYCCQRGTRRA